MKTIDELKHETGVPVVLADELGVITFVNSTFAQLFGWQAAEIVGKGLTAIIPSSLRDAHHLGFSRFLTTGRATLLNQPLSLKVVTRDGRELVAEHRIVAEKQGETWVFGATIAPLATP